MINKDKDPSFKSYLTQAGLQYLGFDPGELDNWWGAKSEVAYQAFLEQQDGSSDWYSVNATSFADPDDITAFKHCKAEGKSDQECFKIGDNGIGYWGDDLTVTIPYCAVTPEKMVQKWGAIDSAKHKRILVRKNDKQVECILADRMPHEINIKNGAGIDLNYTAVISLGLHVPLFTRLEWRWA